MALAGKQQLGNHGYQRPGTGYIVGNCAGVGHQPYELSCELTKRWHAQVTQRLAAMKLELAALEADKVDSIQVFKTLTKRPYEVKQTAQEMQAAGWVYGKVQGYWVWTKHIDFVVGRDHVPSEERGEYASKFGGKGHDFTFYREREMNQLSVWIAQATGDLKKLERRIKEWVYAPEKLVPAGQEKGLGPLERKRLTEAGKDYLVTPYSRKLYSGLIRKGYVEVREVDAFTTPGGHKVTHKFFLTEAGKAALAK